MQTLGCVEIPKKERENKQNTSNILLAIKNGLSRASSSVTSSTYLEHVPQRSKQFFVTKRTCTLTPERGKY